MGVCEGIVFRVKKYAIHDGPGIRTTVFLKGCPLGCWWCHNPEGQAPEAQSIGRVCAGDRSEASGRSETIGRRMTVDEVIVQIAKDLIFYDESGGGATFSGGEPLMQPDFLAKLLERCRKQAIHSAVDTSGYAPADIFNHIAARSDLILFDLKLMDDGAHRFYTGVSNRPILENLAAAARGGRRLRIRFPVIPGITDRQENLRRMIDFLQPLEGVRDIDLLPFHRIADGKYGRLGLQNRMNSTRPPSRKAMERIGALFREGGFNVCLGGHP